MGSAHVTMTHFVSSARSFFLIFGVTTVLLCTGCTIKGFTAESESLAAGQVDTEHDPRIGLYATPTHGNHNGPLGGNQAFYAASLPNYGYGSANQPEGAQPPQPVVAQSPKPEVSSNSSPSKHSYGSYPPPPPPPQLAEAPASASPYASYYGGSQTLPVAPTLGQSSAPYGTYGAYGAGGYASGHQALPSLPTLGQAGPNDFVGPLNILNEEFGHAIPYGAYGTLNKPMTPMNLFPVRYGDGFVSTSYGALMQQLGGGHGAGISVGQGMVGGYGAYPSRVTVNQGAPAIHATIASVNQPGGYGHNVPANPGNAGGYYVQGFVKVPVPEPESSNEFDSGSDQGSNQYNQMSYY